MKKILTSIIALFILTGTIKAQPADKNIWQITGTYLKSQNELNAEARILPVNRKDGSTVLSFYVFTDGHGVLDSGHKIPDSDKMSLYRFCSIGPHSPCYLLIAINSKWQIVDMKESLPNLMAAGAEICNSFDLNADDVMLFMKELFDLYELNRQKVESSGPRITKLRKS